TALIAGEQIAEDRRADEVAEVQAIGLVDPTDPDRIDGEALGREGQLRERSGLANQRSRPRGVSQDARRSTTNLAIDRQLRIPARQGRERRTPGAIEQRADLRERDLPAAMQRERSFAQLGERRVAEAKQLAKPDAGDPAGDVGLWILVGLAGQE